MCAGIVLLILIFALYNDPADVRDFLDEEGKNGFWRKKFQGLKKSLNKFHKLPLMEIIFKNFSHECVKGKEFEGC